jgi:hypothetical protein
MYRRHSVFPRVLAFSLVAVAIVGFVAGRGRAHAAPTHRLLTASTATLLVEYPSSWRTPSGSARVPGLSIAPSIELAPGGDGTRAGFIAGTLLGSEADALPRTFVAVLRQLPETDVVHLLGAQAYRYAGVQVPGFANQLTLYVMPRPGTPATVVVCYAAPDANAELRACERIFATASPIGQSQSYDLTPNPAYARSLTATIAALDQQRVPLRQRMGPNAPAAVLAAAAARLAAAFANAASAVSALTPELPASAAQDTLAASLLKARVAYAAFAAAATAADPLAVKAAGQRVGEAETAVASALGKFTLLGYRPG